MAQLNDLLVLGKSVLLGSIKSNAVHDLMHNGNEFTFASPGHSEDIWINYRTSSGDKDGKITGYRFGDGAGNLAPVYGSIFYGSFSGNAATADKATQDGSGNVITSTYVKKSGDTMTGPLTVGGATIAQGAQVNIIGANKTPTTISNKLVLQEGAVFSGTAAAAGLVTRGICGVSTPEATGECSKDNLYINYDSDNTYRDNRQLVLQAGTIGTHYGSNLYQYAAARGDAVKGWVENSATAAKAAKLATARTITLTGSVTGSGSFDGSGDLSIDTTTNHTHNYAGSASAGGSANSAVKLDSSAGSAIHPIYFSNGKPVASTSTVGSGTQPIYLSSGTITASSSTVGSLTKPVYMSSGTITVCGNSLDASVTGSATTVPKALTSNGKTATTSRGYTYGVAGVTSGNRIYSKWYVNLDNGVTALTDGMLIEIKIPVAGSSSGCAITIDNGTNFHPVIYGSSSIITTHFSANSKILLMYDSTGTGRVYGTIDGSTATSAASITGVWRIMNLYTDGNTYTSAYCSTSGSTAAKTATCSGYYLLSKSQIHVIITTTNTAARALTLNINGQGAKPIYINGTVSSSSNHTLPRGSYLVYYDGTNYYFRTDGAITGNLIGNASTATKLANARTISLSGSVTGSGTFDGSGNLSIETTTNHTHNYAGSSNAGGGAKFLETFYQNSTTNTYGASWNLLAQWINSDRLKFKVINNGTIQNSYSIEVDHADIADIADTATKCVGRYTQNGGQQNPNYFGTNRIGFLMMDTIVNNNDDYKDWMIMDCYASNDAGGSVAFGINRQRLGAYIMRSTAERNSWTESAELLHTSNYNSYALPLSGGTMSGNIILPYNQSIIQHQLSEPNYTTSIMWYKGGVSQKKHNPSIGHFNIGDTDGAMILLPYATDSDPWDSPVGLYLSKTKLSYNGKSIQITAGYGTSNPTATNYPVGSVYYKLI